MGCAIDHNLLKVTLREVGIAVKCHCLPHICDNIHAVFLTCRQTIHFINHRFIGIDRHFRRDEQRTIDCRLTALLEYNETQRINLEFICFGGGFLGSGQCSWNLLTLRDGEGNQQLRAAAVFSLIPQSVEVVGGAAGEHERRAQATEYGRQGQ